MRPKLRSKHTAEFGASQRSMSSITVKAAGTITRVSAVEVMRPPITATAIAIAIAID